MDTGSHVLIGLTLAGLAYIDPAVAASPALAQAVLVGTVVGSNAPDFDTLCRVKGYSFYMRHHRGVTPSLPALALWPIVISLPLAWAFQVTEGLPHLLLWSFVAVALHVGLDLLNVYGVQSMRPIHSRWLHLDVLSIFEPFLAAIHVTGLVLWLALGYDPATVFAAVYGISALYVAGRSLQHAWLLRRVKRLLQVKGVYHVLPDVTGYRWSFVVETDTQFFTGSIVWHRIELEQEYPKEASNEIVRATLGIDGVRAFLGFAQRVHVTWSEWKDGYEVVWSDMRFWYRSKLPFGVTVRLDRNLQVVEENLGWRKKAWRPPYV